MAIDRLNGAVGAIQQSEVPEIPPSCEDRMKPDGYTNGEGMPKPVTTTVTNGFGKSDGNQRQTVHLNTEYAYTARKLRVITIGAGFSGLLMCHKIQHKFPELSDFVEHTLFEAHDDVGGTWLMNNYPGVQCDVPAHIYVSFTVIVKSSSCSYVRHFLSIQIRIGADSIPVVPRFMSTSRLQPENGICTGMYS